MSDTWVSTEEAARIAGYTYRRSLSNPIRRGKIKVREVHKQVRSLGQATRERVVYEVSVESLHAFLASRKQGAAPGVPRKAVNRHVKGEDCRCSSCRAEGLRYNVSVAFSEEQYKFLKRAARRAGLPLSEIIRQAVAEHELSLTLSGLMKPSDIEA